LKNEKYMGDVLLQKTFVEDLFSGKQVKNKGELEKFLIQNHHPAIVSRELLATANKIGKQAKAFYDRQDNQEYIRYRKWAHTPRNRLEFRF